MKFICALVDELTPVFELEMKVRNSGSPKMRRNCHDGKLKSPKSHKVRISPRWKMRKIRIRNYDKNQKSVYYLGYPSDKQCFD